MAGGSRPREHHPRSSAGRQRPNNAVVAPREAQNLGIGRKPMQWVVVPQWVRASTAQVPPAHRLASRSGAHPRASRQGGYGGGGSEQAGRVSAPRKEASCGQQASPQEVVRGKPPVSSGRPAAVLGATGQASRTPPGAQSGAGRQRGSVGPWESPRSPGVSPGEGDRAPTGPGVPGRLAPGHEPAGAPTNAPAAGKGSGSARHAPRPARDRVAV